MILSTPIFNLPSFPTCLQHVPVSLSFSFALIVFLTTLNPVSAAHM